MKRAIITGGSGFIGNWLIKELKKNNIEIIVLSSNVKEINYVSGIEVLNLNECSVDKIGIKEDTVFYHLAWNGIDSRDKNNIEKQIENINISIKALELCANLKCKLFVAAGTVAEYSFNDGIIDFSKKQTPNDLYGAVKVSIHYILDIISKNIGQDMIWAVIPSTFGEGRKKDNIITYTILSLLEKKYPKYGKLDHMWDFLYVEEVARALFLIGERGKANNIYGIGSGVYRPLREYIEIIRDLIDPKLDLGINELPDNLPPQFSSCVDNLKLREDTGFSPQISFEEGIERTIFYYKKNL